MLGTSWLMWSFCHGSQRAFAPQPPFRMWHVGACNNESESRKEVNEMKEALALIGAVCVLAYVCVQALLAALQPLLVALSGHAH